MLIDPAYLAVALQRATPPSTSPFRCTYHDAGQLQLPTGELIACDPGWLRFKPFVQRLPSGNYPVTLTITHFDDRSDQRVAFAAIQLRDVAPVRWSLMTLEGQDVSTLKEGQFFGYGVDAGMGCFADHAALRAVAAERDVRDALIDRVDAVMRQHWVSTWSWGNLTQDDANVVLFSSGWGDGAYPTYLAHAADDQPCAVVTDFMVFRPDDLIEFDETAD